MSDFVLIYPFVQFIHSHENIFKEIDIFKLRLYILYIYK